MKEERLQFMTAQITLLPRIVKNSNERYYSQPNGMVYSEEESMSEKQTAHDLMYSAISVGMSAFKSNSFNSEMKSNDRTKIDSTQKWIPIYHEDLLIHFKCFSVNLSN
ncbi:hypothetical protein WUBG_12987 [Wuchereria bancrofti]|uniref:Uncharacterized protein n=1 Tax=Wuchereria bancrofti TaxID=6293 RepID=J9E1U6_WUCBA|nr:hypothetical protein WUBG_12987 [Wuchereria bancrofti]